ncbi:MAG: hypothetical protein JOZ13_17455 [Alphaproteobacteria bacterium]|nr:hypothetical protein [Alphaproteobacteria bacterium]
MAAVIALHLTDKNTAVTITWQEWVHPRLKTFSSMPSLAFDLHDNPLYDALKQKAKQLSEAPASHLKCIILGDAGCRLLHKPKERSQQTVSGAQIIFDFVRHSDVDIVCILSPRRHNEHIISAHNNPRRWFVEVYDSEQSPEGYYSRLSEAALRLPPPQLHGFQARSFAQQGMLSPQGRGQYLPLSYSGGQKGMTIRISARGVLELLAGCMNPSEIGTWLIRGDNLFAQRLAQGYAISSIKLEPKGPDDDDDYVVITLAPDPNASPLRLPLTLRND